MSSKLKVCHIVNWYPNSKNENEAIWTKRHIESLNAHCDNDVFHVQVVEGRYKFESRIKSSFEQSYILSFPTRIWFLKEILTTLLLCYVILFKLKRSKYDIFNFQITYPLLTYSKLICWLVKKPIVVTEHWSAYHLNFGVEKELKRIKRIFKNKKLKFICVSEALVEDIESFSEKKIDYELVPNVIDDKFKFKGNVKPENSFFLLSYWKEPKDPFMILEVFGRLKTEGHNFVVSIGGYGPMIEKMEETIRKLNLQNNVKLLGVLNDIEIIKQFNENKYFIHNSKYKVASVVCSESICCGTPVIASSVGGITEYIDATNGILIKENDIDTWYTNLKYAITTQTDYDNEGISVDAGKRFYPKYVGKKYINALTKFID